MKYNSGFDRIGGALIFLLAALMGSSCGGGSGGNKTPLDMRELDRNAATWSAIGPRNYRFTIRPSFFAPPDYTNPARIEVRDGVAVSVVAADGSRPIIPANYTAYDTIDKLYTYLRQVQSQNPDEFKITYDADWRFPETAILDYRRLAADDEMSISVTEFEELP